MPIRGMGVLKPLLSNFLMSAFLVVKKFYPGEKVEFILVMLGLAFDLTAPNLLRGDETYTALDVSAPLLGLTILQVSSLAVLMGSLTFADMVDFFERGFKSPLEPAFEFSDLVLSEREESALSLWLFFCALPFDL